MIHRRLLLNKRPLSTKRPEFLESEGETEVSHVGIEAGLEESKAYYQKKKNFSIVHLHCKNLGCKVHLLVYKVTHDARFTHRQLCLQRLLQFYRHHTKHCNNNRSEKTIDDTKSSKNIAAEYGCI